MSYTFLSHTADLKVLVKEKNINLAFSNSAFALREAICGKLEIKPKILKKFSVKGDDFESLFYNFLEEFLFLLDAKGFLLSKIEKFKLDEKNFKISAEVLGDKAENYKFSNDVKAITYNDMFIGKRGKSFICQFVLDV